MNTEALFDLLRAIVLSLVLFGAFRFIGIKNFTPRIIFFALGISCLLLTDFYWQAYDILRPEIRMPFAANEIGEWAFFLLLGASLNSGKPIDFSNVKIEIIFAALFSAGNVALWIAWSGEWIQDILTGIVFAYFLCSLVSRIKVEGVFSAFFLRIPVILCVTVIMAQGVTFLVPKSAVAGVDYACYAMLFIVGITLYIRAVKSLYSRNKLTKIVYNSFIAFAWSVVTLYMSADGFYVLAMAMTMACFPLMLLSLKREVDAE